MWKIFFGRINSACEKVIKTALKIAFKAVQTVDKSPISSERDWTFSMYKMKINVEIPIIKTANMI